MMGVYSTKKALGQTNLSGLVWRNVFSGMVKVRQDGLS